MVRIIMGKSQEELNSMGFKPCGNIGIIVAYSHPTDQQIVESYSLANSEKKPVSENYSLERRSLSKEGIMTKALISVAQFKRKSLDILEVCTVQNLENI